MTVSVHHHPGSGRLDPVDGAVAIEDGGEVWVVVSDEGSWRTAGAGTGWRGRGLKLITALGGRLDIRVGDRGTTTTIRWSLR